MSKKASFAVFIVLLFSLFSADVRAGDPPLWLQNAAKVATPSFETKDVPVVVLYDDSIVNVKADGSLMRTSRFAIRVLVREGREEAVAREVYSTDGEKVTELNAWLLSKTGTQKSYGKKETIDHILADNDLYNEARIRKIDVSDIAEAGDVFGYESVVEEKQIFSQRHWWFQRDGYPVMSSRLVLTLPAGWKAEGVTFNAPKIEPVVNGTSFTWEMRDLPPMRPEAGSPSYSSLAPQVAVSYFPSDPSAAPIKTFSKWNDVARWMAELEDPQMTVDDALAAKAQDLTANAKTEFERIQAISRYVQQIQYISIQVGTGRGGGYRPRLATEVFAKSYGDCKDKANLMRAMLSVLKITAYMVSITADDPDYIKAEWASPYQFNHCIIAIKVSDETKAHSIVTDPKLGRLLFFDPTDPYTPIGDLPEDEQGSLALIDHKETDSLIRMPVMPAEMNKLERNVNISLDQNGDISGTINEKTSGQKAAGERARLRRLSSADYKNIIERWISRGATAAKTTKITPKDSHIEGLFDLNVEFAAPNYAQLMQNRLMVFKPAILDRLGRMPVTEGKRTLPVQIDAGAYSESVKIKLPAGFVVDEMPEATKVETPFGTYNATYELSGDTLHFKRSMKLNRTVIAAEKYETVKYFFGRVNAADQAPVVLIKK